MQWNGASCYVSWIMGWSYMKPMNQWNVSAYDVYPVLHPNISLLIWLFDLPHSYLAIHPTKYFSNLYLLSNSINNWKNRSSHRRCSLRKGVPTNFAKFTGNNLCQSLFFNKVAGWSLCELCELLRKAFLQNISGRLLLKQVVLIIKCRLKVPNVEYLGLSEAVTQMCS